MRHLAKVAAFGKETGMHSKNLAIVWAPNLLRYKWFQFFDVGTHLFPKHAVRTVHSPLTLCVVGQRSWSVEEEQQPCRGSGSRQSSLNA